MDSNNQHSRQLLSGPTPKRLIGQLREVAQRLRKKTLTCSEFVREAGVLKRHVYKHFAKWDDALSAAGLGPVGRRRIQDDELLEAMRAAFVSAGYVCSQKCFLALCRHSIATYRSRRWGGDWTAMLLRFREWVLANAPDFPYLDQLPLVGRSGSGACARSKRWLNDWAMRGVRRYGSPLNFRSMLHAPRNELGVVFLFGIVAEELGYVVEGLSPGFPDCEAKRRSSKSNHGWRRVCIEFEYQSRSFLTHRHNPEACHLIVCWEDNWPECPIEVLELKSVIGSLGARRLNVRTPAPALK